VAYLIAKERNHIPFEKHSSNLLLLQSVNMNGDNVTEEKKETKALCADTIPLRISEMGQDIKFQRMIE